MSYSRRHWFLALFVVAAAVAARLGFWQLSRLRERRAANTVQLAARELPPIDLSLPGADDSLLDGRRIVARGRFEPAEELLLRNRAHNQAPGVHVATPFEISSSGDQLWVVRGFAFAPDGITPPTVADPAPGEVTITGIGSALPVTDDGGQPILVGERISYRRLDRGVARERKPKALDGFLYLAGDTGGPGRLPAVEPPALDEGPHFSYAIQWFGIATAILAFGWFIVFTPRAGREHAPPP